VVRAFQTILKTRQFVKATQAAVTALEGNQATAMKRLVGGTLLKSDELDIEVRLRQACEDLVRARNANTLAVLALRNLLGMESGEFAVADTAPKATVPSGDDFSHRPEIAAAHERERAAAAEMRGAQSGYQPSVSAFGSLDHDYGWVTGGDGNSYTAGVMLQWDLWDGFSSRAKTREASANLESAREEQRKLRLALNFEVEQAQLDLSAANERLAVTETSIEQALESEKLTRDRFEQGLAISTQLIDAETALVAARVRRAEAESDQPIAVAGLRKALALPQLDGQPTAK
jgi:outer membrane protein TolC